VDTESDWLQVTLGKQLCGSEGERVVAPPLRPPVPPAQFSATFTNRQSDTQKHGQWPNRGVWYGREDGIDEQYTW
jgi:hypothetical protein